MGPPTFPYPWMATRVSSTDIPRCFSVELVMYVTPRAVAAPRPFDPPTDRGFPVTTPGTEYPTFMEYVSMIQAMIWSSVPMSGAGMSRSGPISGRISAA